MQLSINDLFIARCWAVYMLNNVNLTVAERHFAQKIVEEYNATINDMVREHEELANFQSDCGDSCKL